MSGCYGDSCDVLRFNEVCKHCREVQPADSRLFDERQADRCYHHADVASASIPDDASRACLRIDGIEDHLEDRPRILPNTRLFQGRTSFIPTCCRSLPPFALNTLSLKQGSIDTGRRGCGRLSLNKHGLECEQQQSKEKLYVSSWTDVPCARRILDRRHASSRSSKFTPLAPTSCMKCRAWRLGGLTVVSLAVTSWFTWSAWVKWCRAWGEASRIAWTGPSRSATTSPIGTLPTRRVDAACPILPCSSDKTCNRFRREQCRPERRSARSINVCERTDEPWRLPAEVMCRVQREKMWYAGQQECILWSCQGQNGNPG